MCGKVIKLVSNESAYLQVAKQEPSKPSKPSKIELLFKPSLTPKKLFVASHFDSILVSKFKLLLNFINLLSV